MLLLCLLDVIKLVWPQNGGQHFFLQFFVEIAYLFYSFKKMIHTLFILLRLDTTLNFHNAFTGMRAKLVRKKYSLLSGGTHISPAIKKPRFWDVTHASSDLFFLCFSTELTAKYLILKRNILQTPVMHFIIMKMHVFTITCFSYGCLFTDQTANSPNCNVRKMPC